jgi:hypothetical protein
MAGLDAIVKQDGKIVAYATGVTLDEDFELQGIRTLGFHGDRDFKSMGYTASFRVGTFVLLGGAIEGALTTPTRTNILQATLLDFEIIDLINKQTLYIAQGCKCATKNTAIESGALATKDTTWRCKNIKPLQVS